MRMFRFVLLLAVLVPAVLVARRAAVAADAAPSVRPWQTSLSVGLTLTAGNSETLVANAGLAIEKESKPNLLRAGTEVSYGETVVETESGATDRETTMQNAKAYANYKRAFARAFGYLDGAALHDEIADVQYRVIVGPGIGWFAIDSERAKLSLEFGPGWLTEEVANEQDDMFTARVAERFSYHLSKTAKLWQSLEYLADSADLDDYLLNAEFGVEAAVNSHLSLRLVVQDKYDSVPAEARDENDLTVIGGLSYRL